MNPSICQMEQYVWDKLFYPQTNLIYDLRLTLEPDGLLTDLPTPEEIARNYPNPCSWKTGMENSMINAGLMLDSVILQYQKTGNSEMRDAAKKLFDGIKLCATVSGVEGFLARSVCPFDKKSYYVDSSRDQYTHIVYSLCHYLQSDLCDDKQAVKDILRSFAERAARNICEESNYDMLRADGKGSFVNKMWGDIHGHEYLRLPMFYLAAHFATGEEKWKFLYLQLRDEAIKRSYNIVNKEFGFFAYMQMQLSIRLLYELDEEYKDQYIKLMHFVIDTCVPKMMAKVQSVKAENNHFNKPYLPWRTLPPKKIFEIDGLQYLIPDRNEYDMFLMWDIADSILCMALCPEYEISAEYKNAFFEVAEMVDIEHHYTESPIHFIAAYWNMKG